LKTTEAVKQENKNECGEPKSETRKQNECGEAKIACQ